MSSVEREELAQVEKLREALRQVLVIAAPAWGVGGWEEYGDIAGICEGALGESLIEAELALAERRIQKTGER